MCVIHRRSRNWNILHNIFRKLFFLGESYNTIITRSYVAHIKTIKITKITQLLRDLRDLVERHFYSNSITEIGFKNKIVL